ncbi:DUF1161 domain-containing protein [Pseudomonas weihenstephanensis]|uniref:DUF1161 domain-containing protein n=1 Tax=Pseudomonas weihenstephanensis TaxID=1608994 RepID=UPI00193B0E25|nr:DUF1161 domain-containing protein [Pseudomonas weihenstephanensis]MBM1191042.1 DUF1161 domain-containing protein [Pseudomonas weihenstephanensis]GLX89573.1 hypothetical protein Pfra02_21420 [Pseudomonas fragi]
MKKILVAVSLMTLASTAFAAKDCGELKNEIAAKVDAKGVAHYSLEIVDKGASADGKVVGTCGGDTKEIVYKRG